MHASHDSIKQTADRIRANSKSWSLEGDAEFLKLMTDISNNLIERGNKTSMGIHQMMLDLSNTGVGLGNVTNRLLALQNSQFIENRVQEDDEFVVDKNENRNEVDAAPKEPAFSETLQSTFHSGIKMMNKYYDKVTFQFDDSDDEAGGAAQKSVLYLPKNLYKDRQLPYLIGSKEWQENRHIGLINADDTRNEPIDGLHKSVEDISNDNTSMSISNSERASEHDIDNEDEDNISNQSNSISDRSLPREFKPAPVRLFYQEGVISNSELPTQPIINPTTASLFATDNYRNQYAASNLFDDQPPEIQESSVRISSVRQVRKPVNLFDDDESDDDSFIFNSTNMSQKADSEPQNPVLREKGQMKVVSSKIPDPLMAALKTKLGERKSENFTSYDDSNKVLPTTFAQQTAVTEEKKLETSKTFASIKTNLFSGESDDEGTLFAPKKLTVKRTEVNDNTNKTSISKPVNLFDDEDSDSVEKVTNLPRTETTESSSRLALDATDTIKTSILKVVDLFADTNDENEDDLFLPKPKTVLPPKATNKVSSKLFADDSSDDENNIFSTKNRNSSTTKQLKEKTQDIVASKKSVKTDTKSTRTNLFSNDTSDDDDNSLFVKKSEKSIQKEPRKPVSHPTILKKSNLFGDSSDQDDPLFAPPFLSKSYTPIVSAPAEPDITKEVAPKKHLVTSPARKESKEEIRKTLKIPEPSSQQPAPIPSKTKSIFGDDDESDLFVSQTKVRLTEAVSTDEAPKVDSDVKEQLSNTCTMPTTNLSHSKNDTDAEDSVKTELFKDLKPESEHSISKPVVKNFDFLTSLLDEDPPDETIDVIKPRETDTKKKSLFMTDSFSDEKNSLCGDSDFVASDNGDQNQKQTINENDKQMDENKKLGNYSSLQLFNEEPPEDDNIKFSAESMPTTKRSILGVFDDSSNLIGKDTVSSESDSKRYKYNMFMDDEPPPDDFDEYISSNVTKPISLPEQSLKKQILIQAALATIPKVVKSNLTSDSEPEIKVGASKPTSESSSAKRTPTKRTLPNRQSSSDTLSSLDVQITTKPLDSLNKTRAKISKPRRPSTRFGRQKQLEKYAHSIKDDDVADGALPSSDNSGSATTKGISQSSNQNASKTGTDVVAKVPKHRVFNLTGNQKELQSKLVSELQKRKSAMFKDDDESNTSSTDSDWLVKSEPVRSNMGSKEIADVLTIADQGKCKESNISKIGTNNTLTTEKDSKSGSSVHKLENKLEKEPIKNISKSSGLAKSSMPEVSKNSMSLFGDDSSDEDFFKEQTIKTSLTAKKTSSCSLKTAASTAMSEAEVKSANKEKFEKKTKSKLFSSSEDDDDNNLFLTKAKPTPTASTILPNQSKAQSQPKKIQKTVTLSKAIENPLGDLFD